ncbi:MAG: flagellar basal body P-ring protein FlgI [Pseudomonadota bacterium]
MRPRAQESRARAAVATVAARRVVAATVCFLTLWLATAFVLAPAVGLAQPRIKDLVTLEAAAPVRLVGYGLITGLDDTGDNLARSDATREALIAWYDRLGLPIDRDIRLTGRSTALVLVTAETPPFPSSGARFDLSVAVAGDASSLLGGELLMSPLYGEDGEIYAVGSGAVVISGLTAEGQAAAVTEGVPTVGKVPGGGRLDRSIDHGLGAAGRLRLVLRDPDFTTARRIVERINAHLGRPVAGWRDPGSVELDVARAGLAPASLIAEVEALRIAPDSPARVIIDQKSGTIVMGENVRISKVAISQGNLTVRVEETPLAVQPNPFARGETVVVPRTDIQIDVDGTDRLAIVDESTTLADLVSGLNALGIGPRDMIDILVAIDAAGALHADLVIE